MDQTCLTSIYTLPNSTLPSLALTKNIEDLEKFPLALPTVAKNSRKNSNGKYLNQNFGTVCQLRRLRAVFSESDEKF